MCLEEGEKGFFLKTHLPGLERGGIFIADEVEKGVDEVASELFMGIDSVMGCIGKGDSGAEEGLA